MTSVEEKIAKLFRVGGMEQPQFEARQLILALPADAGPETARHWAAERLRGIPLAYLSGRKGFYKHEFLVAPGVLVPRPETEHAVTVALARAREENLIVKNLGDLGSGSGCLGLSIAYEIPGARLFAVDASETACAITRKNAAALGIAARTEVIHSAVEQWNPGVRFELIAANPPYIAAGDPAVQKSVHDHEPHQALYSGSDGLNAIRLWSEWSSGKLIPGGIFVCEFGTGQTSHVQEILSQFGFERIRIEKDLAGIDRVISAVRKR